MRQRRRRHRPQGGREEAERSLHPCHCGLAVAAPGRTDGAHGMRPLRSAAVARVGAVRRALPPSLHGPTSSRRTSPPVGSSQWRHSSSRSRSPWSRPRRRCARHGRRRDVALTSAFFGFCVAKYVGCSIITITSFQNY